MAKIAVHLVKFDCPAAHKASSQNIVCLALNVLKGYHEGLKQKELVDALKDKGFDKEEAEKDPNHRSTFSVAMQWGIDAELILPIKAEVLGRGHGTVWMFAPCSILVNSLVRPNYHVQPEDIDNDWDRRRQAVVDRRVQKVAADAAAAAAAPAPAAAAAPVPAAAAAAAAANPAVSAAASGSVPVHVTSPSSVVFVASASAFNDGK